jgi:hypothetical protein
MSMLFNTAFYLKENPDVLLAVAQKKIASAEAHFNEFGAAEGRNPNATFDTKSYFINNPDVLSSGMNPLTHFLKFGAAEGRSPSPSFVTKAQFDTVAYAAANPDLAKAGITTSAGLFEHFAKFGFSETRPGVQTTKGVAITDGVAGGAVGTTFTLTSGTDTLTGTSSADTFNADLLNEGGVANVTSLNSTDNINGGNGADTLTATYDDAVSATISNVETLNLSGRAAVAFDFINVTGVTDMNISASSAAVDLNNIAAVPANINISNQSQNVDLDFAAAAVAGSADVATISVASMTAGTLTVDTGIETVALTSKGSTANVIADLTTGTATTGAKSVTIAGSQDLTITATLDAPVATINAATATGKVNVTQTNTVVSTITGGKGDDTVVLGAGYVGGTTGALRDTLNGGDGTDTLSITDAVAAVTVAQSNVTNFEALTISDALDGSAAYNFAHFGAGVTKLNLALGHATTAATVTLNDKSTVDFAAGAEIATDARDLTFTTAATGTANAVSFEFEGAANLADLIVTNFETVTINSKTTANAFESILLGQTAATESLIITGDANFTIGAGDSIRADVIDASKLTGILDMGNTATDSNGSIITGGNKADTLLGSTSGDIITGGEGADTITGFAGDDVISLAETTAAIDTVVFTAFAANGSDTINGFVQANDIINVELLAAGNVAGEIAIAANAAIADVTDQFAVVFANGADGTGTEVITDYTNLTDVAAFMEAGLDIANGEDFAVVINDLAGKKAYVYSVNEANANATIDAGEVTLVGTINTDAALTIANTDFA